MIVALIAIPFLLSGVIGGGAPLLARHCSPRWLTIALTALALSAALSTGVVLCALATLSVTETPWAARLGHWSAGSLVARLPVPAAAGDGAGLIALALAVAAATHLVRALRSLWAGVVLGRALGPTLGGLILVEDERAGAYALPGLPGRTVVSRSLLRRLDAVERRAVLAHEAAHLRHRHFVYVQLTELAAAANPFLRPAVRVVRLAVEAWADDVAACAVGNRLAVARAVAKASLARAGAAPAGALAIGSPATDLAHRIGNLVTPQPTRTGRVVAALLTLTAACALSAAAFALVAHAAFETAESSYLVR